MTEFTLVEKLRDGSQVFVDEVNSHAATHLQENKQLFQTVRLALGRINPQPNQEIYQVDFSEPVGTTDLVETTDEDTVVYAKRLNRQTFTRFAKGREPSPTSSVTVVLHKHKTSYELWSAWFGVITPTFPGDENEMANSREFWSSHALIWGKQAVQPGSETTTCPW